MENMQVLESLFSLLFSEELASNFIVKSVQEYPEHIEIVLEEDSHLIPSSLSSVSDVVLDGFCNPKELQSFPMKGKAVYLKVYRRRWKEKGSSKHHSNNYNLNPKGVKATKSFSSFLKETYGYTTSQYNDYLRKFMRKL